jgi:hypothetical protein
MLSVRFNDSKAEGADRRPRQPRAYVMRSPPPGIVAAVFMPVVSIMMKPPESVAAAIFADLERDEEEIFPDPLSQSIAEGWRNGAANGPRTLVRNSRPAEYGSLNLTGKKDRGLDTRRKSYEGR